MKPKKNSARRPRTKPPWQTKIAEERIVILFDEARKMVRKDRALANRYVALARKIGMRYNVRIPETLRRQMCRGCKAFLYPGVSTSQRTEHGIIRIKCLSCGKVMSRPIKH